MAAGGAMAAGAIAGGFGADPAAAADTTAPAIVKQPKGKKDTTPQPKPKAAANVYLFMLVLSLLFIIIGSAMLVTELQRYNFERVPPTPLR
jgi:hypothetical protein